MPEPFTLAGNPCLQNPRCSRNRPKSTAAKATAGDLPRFGKIGAAYDGRPAGTMPKNR